jgi:PAS domain S-box-containing protein
MQMEAEASVGLFHSVPFDPEAIRLRGLIDGIDAVVYEATPSGWVRFINCRGLELFGYSEKRWLSQPRFWETIAHVDDRPIVRDRFYQCVRHGHPKELEHRVVKSDGKFVWVRGTFTAGRNVTGQVASVRTVLWVDRPRRAERQLSIARQELSDRLADMVQLHDLSQRLWVSRDLEPLLEEILRAATSIQGADMGLVRLYDPVYGDLRIVASVGLPPEYLERYRRVPTAHAASGMAIEQGRPVLIEDVEADPAAAPYREAARLAGYRAKYTTLLASRSGEPLGTIASCFCQPHRPPEREMRLVELFARQAADFIDNARLYRTLQEADRYKDDALATLAHELRNPLSVISNAAQLLRMVRHDELKPGPVGELIGRQVDFMTRLTSDLLETACAGRREIELRLEPVEIRSAMARAAESVGTLVEERRHGLSVLVPPEPIWVEADPVRLEQVFVNLLVNASRYTEPGGKLTMEATSGEDEVSVRVRDTGVGIAPELLDRVFDAFVRGSGSASPAGTGLGLGLTLVRRLVERHGGTVTATSDGPGKGSEFVVRLPRLGR